jgi:hypothetical protein
MNEESLEEMHLQFTLMDAAELAHKIGYAEWMRLFVLAYLKHPATPKEM